MPSQRETLKDLFGAALELKPEDRAAFLNRDFGDSVLNDSTRERLTH